MRYVGFWARFLAFVVDSILVALVLSPIGILLFGVYALDPSQVTTAELMRVMLHPSNLLNHLLTLVAVVAFWVWRSATPGKMVIRAVIVDARTGQKPTTAQFIGRYLGYFVSIIPFGLGLLWVAFDPRKQGWHDKLAGTVVVRP